MPRAPVRLFFLALAPLIVSGLICLVRDIQAARAGAIAFSIYAAVLLSFFGGVRCGFELKRAPDHPHALRLIYCALPALAGWGLALFITIMPVPPGAAAAFAGLFAAQNAWDAKSAETGAPNWYPTLRQVITGALMIICLLLPFADIMRRF